MITRKRGKYIPTLTDRTNDPREPTVNRDNVVGGRTTLTKKPNHIICYKCGQPGHIAVNCRLARGPEMKKVGEAKPQGPVRFCTDYRKLNNVTKEDSYPIPRMEDCIDQIGKAKFITKCDLLKGYWSVPLTDQAKLKSAFVVPDGTYHYNVMPFGMRNSQAIFMRLMNKCITGIPNVGVYVYYIIIYKETW